MNYQYFLGKYSFQVEIALQYIYIYMYVCQYICIFPINLLVMIGVTLIDRIVIRKRILDLWLAVA